MYQLTDSDLNQISAWFFQDVPCKNGISIIDLIKTLSEQNANVDTVIISDIKETAVVPKIKK